MRAASRYTIAVADQIIRHKSRDIPRSDPDPEQQYVTKPGINHTRPRKASYYITSGLEGSCIKPRQRTSCAYPTQNLAHSQLQYQMF